MQDETQDSQPHERQSIATPGYPDPSLPAETAAEARKRKRHYIPAIVAAIVLVVALFTVLTLVFKG